MATRVVREDIQQGSRDFWLLANGDNIPVGYAEHFIAGTSYETPTYLFDVEGYYPSFFAFWKKCKKQLKYWVI